MAADDTFDFDPERYRADLAELSLTPEQETELLGCLWSIMRSFVELGFSVEGCGQLVDAFEEAATAAPRPLELFSPEPERKDDAR